MSEEELKEGTPCPRCRNPLDIEIDGRFIKTESYGSSFGPPIHHYQDATVTLSCSDCNYSTKFFAKEYAHEEDWSRGSEGSSHSRGPYCR